MFAIMVDYYCWSEEKGEYTMPLYLGVEGPRKLFIFEEEVTANTKKFETAEQAGKYLDLRLNMLGCGSCCENVRIVGI